MNGKIEQFIENSVPKVSIIIPVYNVQDYISNCIASLQIQTLKDLEFIFVDDCSEDASAAIIEEAAKKDIRIKILHNEKNLGAGKSRNRGIDAARGEFIAFVDSDDWVDPDFYEVLYNRAVLGKYDIVKANRVKVLHRRNGEIRYKKSPVNERIIRGLSDGNPLYRYFTSEHQTAIFRREMIKQHQIYNGSTSHSENSVFLLGASYFCQRFCIESNISYYYFQRSDSSVHVFNRDKFQNELISFHEQIDFLEKENVPIDSHYYKFIKNKVAFLMRRYDELQKIAELADYHREFVDTLCNELERLRGKETLLKAGPKMRMLLKHNTGLFVFVNKYNRQILWIRGVEKKVKKRINKIKGKAKKKLKQNPLFKLYKNIIGKKQPSFLKEFDHQKIIYLQNFRGCILFSKEFIEIGGEFAKAYINGFKQNSGKYNCTLRSDDELYIEHLARINQGELCWRYTKRFGYISKTTVYLDQNGTMRLKGEILGSHDVIETSQFIVHPQVEREIINGKVLKEYIAKKKSTAELVGELRQYLDYLFEKFAVADRDKLEGIAYDAFPYNCILKEGHVYELFDLEFEFKEPLDKAYMVYKTVKTLPKKKQKCVYFELCAHYQIVANWEYWNAFNFRIWMDTISDIKQQLSEENQLLYKKYYIL